MLTDHAIRAQWRHDGHVTAELAIAAIAVPVVGGLLLFGLSPWQAQLEALVANDASGGRIALHMAIPVLPALPFAIALLAHGVWCASRRRAIRCGHCDRMLNDVTLETGACAYCGRHAVTLTGPSHTLSTSDAAAHPSAPADGPRVATAAEFRALLRRASLPALFGVVGTIVGLGLNAALIAWLGHAHPAAPRSGLIQATLLGFLVLVTLGPMMLGCVMAERRFPRCPSCRTAIKPPAHLVIATGRCRACGVEILRRADDLDQRDAVGNDRASEIATVCSGAVGSGPRAGARGSDGERPLAPLRDRALFNRGADLYRRIGVLPCLLGAIVGFGLFALVRLELDEGRGWLGFVVLVAMMATILVSGLLLPRIIDRHVACGHARCPSCDANLLASRRVVGATGRCCRCGRVMFAEDEAEAISAPSTPPA